MREGLRISYLYKCFLFTNYLRNTLLTTRNFFVEDVVLVSFGNDSIVELCRPKSTEYGCLNTGYLSVSKYAGFAQLLELYYLIVIGKVNMGNRIFTNLEKILNQRLSEYENIVFCVKQDYEGISSLLTFVSLNCTLKVVGIQHGLISQLEINTLAIYPGIKTKWELFYSDYYATNLGSLKDKTSKAFVVGYPSIQRKHWRVVYISSGDSKSHRIMNNLFYLRDRLRKLSVDFKVKWHPSEQPFEGLPHIDTLDLSTDNVIYVGRYSTLLYEIGVRGKSTIWIKDYNICTNEDYSSLRDEIRAIPVEDVSELLDVVSQELRVDEGFEKRFKEVLKEIR